MGKDAYDITDKLKNLMVTSGQVVEISSEFRCIQDDAERVKFLEKLLVEHKLMPQNEYKVEKYDEYAVKFRDMGNQYYQRKQFFEAIEFYNKSLAHSPKNSENLGIAFASK
jgi:tetratricopeptide (TPR) repeat protein